ncbi:MAG TPA: alpha-ketoacid dehydrogenase subunit beta [Candidatus Binatia bacterium]|nr:alpha-ketoacid dehydrogenase subunit beta [Candidatus Binatia bacterium]
MQQTFLDAIGAGLHEAMSRDPTVYLFGEDIALGGPFGVTKGLAEQFGANRVVNTPISEATVMGIAIGAATAGLRPVVEIMFIDFITLALDQLVNHAAKLHYMSGGQLTIPLTVRVQCGISGTMGAHHSQSLEAWLTHVPGLKVVMPSNPADAKGLLQSAIRDENPVIFIEHRGLYWSKGEVPDGEHLVPIGKASVVREGTDITIVAVANMIGAALAAARELAVSGIEAEIIDPRSLSPIDVATIASSVKKTSHLIIVHEAVEQGGIGAEIAARVQHEAFYYMDAPIMRVAAPFAPVPASPILEKQFLPSCERILAAARKSLGRTTEF